MTTQDRALNPWTKLPISLRAIISGLLIALAAANVWPLLLLNLGVPLAAFAEAIFLALYLWWAGGGGPPRVGHRSPEPGAGPRLHSDASSSGRVWLIPAVIT